jgi:hypothetical protein
MEPSDFAHLQQKIRVEQIRNAVQQQQFPSCPPPPYEDDDSDMNSDEEDDEDAEAEAAAIDKLPPSSLPLKLTINAANRIQGNGNLVPISATPLADASSSSHLLLQAVSQLNAVAAAGEGRAARPLNVDLTINCGITVIGDRNVVGNVGLRPKAGTPIASMTDPTNITADPALAATMAPRTPCTSGGAKRKASEVSWFAVYLSATLLTFCTQTDDVDDEPAAKKVAVGAKED